MNYNNEVVLIDYMGSDKSHGLAAWASTFAELGIEYPQNIPDRVDALVGHILNNGKKKKSLDQLLDFLASESHTSPFRFSSFVFAMNTDIASHIQKLKHRVILEAENAESARYKELMDDKFYIPQDWLNHRDDLIKTWADRLREHSETSNELYHDCLKDLSPILGRKRAKETARYFKGYNSQLNSFNKFSFDGILQFYKKRGDREFVQDEIVDISEKMIQCIKDIPGNPFQYSLKAFGL